MKTEIQEIIDAWVALSEKISKYPPNYPKAVKFLPFQIEFVEDKYILSVDLNIFDEKTTQP